jgi:hypothetical protein
MRGIILTDLSALFRGNVSESCVLYESNSRTVPKVLCSIFLSVLSLTLRCLIEHSLSFAFLYGYFHCSCLLLNGGAVVTPHLSTYN